MKGNTPTGGIAVTGVVLPDELEDVLGAGGHIVSLKQSERYNAGWSRARARRLANTDVVPFTLPSHHIFL